MTQTHDAGFTLIEVLVAMMIGAMAVAGAAALFQGLSDRAEAVGQQTRLHNRERNAQRLLRHLVSNLELRGDMRPSMAGDARHAEFKSWCESPRGWLERCDVRLLLSRVGDSTQLSVHLAGASSVTLGLPGNAGRVSLRYLERADYGGSWREQWSDVTLPLALAIVTDRDTLLLPVRSGG